MSQFNRLRSATILIVESEGIVRLELADWLSELGLVVLTGNDADEAIVLLGRHPDIEIMLTDIRMSGSMDGVRLAHQVRDRWPLVKIIVASGELGTQLSQLPKGSVFAPKPLDRQNLWRLLAHMTNGADEGAPPYSAPAA